MRYLATALLTVLPVGVFAADWGAALKQFDPRKIIGEIKTDSVNHNPKFPVDDMGLLIIGSKLGAESDKTDFQDSVGNLKAYSCNYFPGSGRFTCDFTYELGSDICWYGYEHIKAVISLEDKTVLRQERFWKAD